MAHKLSFDQWKRMVDTLLTDSCGLDSESLPDVDYYTWWSAGVTPDAACRRVLSQNAMATGATRERVKLVDDVRRFRQILAAVRILTSNGFDEAAAIELIIAERRKRGFGV